MNINMENESVRSSTENVPSTTQSTITLDRKEDDKEDEYNPFEHRNVVHPTSTLGAFFHLLKSSLGSGLLAMPAAFKNTGLVPGCIGTVLVGIIATHCVHILSRLSNDITRTPSIPAGLQVPQSVLLSSVHTLRVDYYISDDTADSPPLPPSPNKPSNRLELLIEKMSDSECDYSQASITEQKVKAYRKPSADSNGKRKMQSQTTTVARTSKKVNTGIDIFGISKNRDISHKDDSSDHLTSFFVNRVGSGCERRATTTDGEYYIDCKVYKADDARLTDSAELWKKALVRMKFQTNADSPQWRKLQELVSTSREVCKKSRVPLLSYTDTCEEVFKQGPKKLKQYSKHIRHFVDAAMAGVCLGGTSVYVIFIASSLKDIFDHFAPSTKYEVEVYCGILLLPLILITQIRHLKFLVPFSVLANVCLVVTFGITCYYTFTDLPPISNIEMVASVEKWPLFLSTAIFAMEGINVVMPVENEMAKPQDFLGCPSVLNVTMIFVAILYGVVGIFGYMKYGEGVLGSITLNLPEGESLALTAKILVALAVFFTYCLQMYAPMDIIWTRIKPRFSKNYYNISQIMLRTFGVTLTVILAVAVPDLELLIGLVGAIFFSTLGLLIPVVVQTVHQWERGMGRFSYILWKNVLLLIFYIIVLFSGCYAAVSEIVIKFR